MVRLFRALLTALLLAATILVAAGNDDDEKHRTAVVAGGELVEVEIKARGAYVMYVIMDAEMEKDNPKPHIHLGIDKIDTRIFRRKSCCGWTCYHPRVEWIERRVIEMGIGQSVKLKLRKDRYIEYQAVAGEFVSNKITKGGKIKCTGMTCKMKCEYEG